MNFAKNLKLLLQQKGVSQKELAEKVGVKPSAISRYVNTGGDPSFKMLEKLTEFFGVSYDDLIIKDLSIEEPKGLPKEEPMKNQDELVGVIVRLQSQLSNVEAHVGSIADADLKKMQRLIQLKETLIKENPDRAKELDLIDE